MSTYVVTTSGSGQPGCESGKHLVDAVAVICGGVDESSVRVQALDCINRARNEINMHDWRFLKRSVSNTAFVAAQATYALPSVFKSPSFFRVLDSNSKPFRDLRYSDDAGLAHSSPQQTASGVPAVYALRNSFNDGLITFYPVPDATSASSYFWAGEYYTRVLTITDDTTPISDVPEEICNVLIAGGQYYLASERLAHNMTLVSMKLGDYQRTKQLALVNDRRMTDEATRFRLRTPTTAYPADSSNWYGWFGW